MASSDEYENELPENEIEELFGDEDENVGGDDDESAKGGDNKGDVKEKEDVKVVKKRVMRNPRLIINFERLKGPNGFDSLIENFSKFKFKGKHFEKEDLSAVMKIMQHWMCHHLYPGYDIETCMKALEKLGRKRVIQTHMRRMRQEAKYGSLENKENKEIVTDNNLDCTPTLPEDGFDQLLSEIPMET